MITQDDVNAAVDRLAAQIHEPSDFQAWAEARGLDEDVVPKIGGSAVATIIAILASEASDRDDGAVEFNPDLVGTMVAQGFALGFEVGRTVVPDEALPSIDNVLDENPDEA